MKHWVRHTGEFLDAAVSNRRGNVVMTFALAALPILMAVTGAVDVFGMSNQKSLLQSAVDSAALAGASKLSVASYNAVADVTSTALAAAQKNVANASDPSIYTFTVSVNQSTGDVTVDGQAAYKPISAIIGVDNQPVRATATAEALQKTPLCVLQTDSGGVDLDNSSKIQAPGCLIHANQNIKVGRASSITAERIQAGGTVTGTTYPAGNSGAMIIADPFAGMDLNPKTLCDLKLGAGVGIGPIKADTTLPPGVHCLPILVVGNARLHLQPGDHYFMGGLLMTQNSALTGDDVALIFGPANIFNFADKANIRLTARTKGPFAGFLIATTRDNHNIFKISSGNVGQLLGTIYIPEATLEVTAQGNVAQDSDWSVIVARSLQLKNGPTLVINNSYVGSGVPVPEGVGPSSGMVLKQ